MQRFIDGLYFGKSCLWIYLVTVLSQLGGSGAGPSQLDKYWAISFQKLQWIFDGPYFGKSNLWVYLITMFSQLRGFWGWAKSAGPVWGDIVAQNTTIFQWPIFWEKCLPAVGGGVHPYCRERTREVPTRPRVHPRSVQMYRVWFIRLMGRGGLQDLIISFFGYFGWGCTTSTICCNSMFKTRKKRD